MKLKLHRVLGYQGSEPILGAVVATFIGNEKKCTKDAKQWIKDNPNGGGVLAPVMKWEK